MEWLARGVVKWPSTGRAQDKFTGQSQHCLTSATSVLESGWCSPHLGATLCDLRQDR